MYYAYRNAGKISRKVIKLIDSMVNRCYICKKNALSKSIIALSNFVWYLEDSLLFSSVSDIFLLCSLTWCSMSSEDITSEGLSTLFAKDSNNSETQLAKAIVLEVLAVPIQVTECIDPNFEVKIYLEALELF